MIDTALAVRHQQRIEQHLGVSRYARDDACEQLVRHAKRFGARHQGEQFRVVDVGGVERGDMGHHAARLALSDTGLAPYSRADSSWLTSRPSGENIG